jgi:hypothetical protein
MKMINGISIIFLIAGLLIAPGCVFAAGNDCSTDSGFTFQSDNINPLEKGGGSKGGGSSSVSKSVKKLDTDDDGDVDDDDGGWGWIIFLIILIVILAIAFIVYKVYFKK